MSLINKIQKGIVLGASSAILLGFAGVTYFGSQHTKAQDDLMSSSNITDYPALMQDLNTKIEYSADLTIAGGALLGLYGLGSLINRRRDAQNNQKLINLLRLVADERSNAKN
ncbi:MAG: hypothetical protein WCK29_02250 [archaeon]